MPGTKEPPGVHKASGIQRALTLHALFVSNRIGRWHGNAWVTPLFVIKRGRKVRMSEAENMHFVRSTTSLPVPKVYYAFERHDNIYIVMQRVRGLPLRNVWPTLHETQQQALLAHLRDYMDELRALVPPVPGRVGSAGYGPLRNDRLGSTGFGPFNSVQDFHRFLAFDQALESPPRGEEELAAQLQKKTWRTCFTHGDLNSLNVLIHKGQITAMLDWEMGGWLPEWYEASQACNTNIYDGWWQRHVQACLDPYPRESRVAAWIRELSETSVASVLDSYISRAQAG